MEFKRKLNLAVVDSGLFIASFGGWKKKNYNNPKVYILFETNNR